MKWLTNLVFAWLLLSGAALSQSFTQVSAVARDVHGNIYANCSYSVTFMGQSTEPGPYLLQGSVFQQNYAGVRCDGFGNLSIRLPSNLAIFPQPSAWAFHVCDQSGQYCNAMGSAVLTVAGALQNITSPLSFVLPILGGGGGGGGGGGWNPPNNVSGNTLFGNNTVGTGTPTFFIPGGDVSFSSGTFWVNSLHFGSANLFLTNTGLSTGNCLQVSGSNIIGGACGTGGGGGNATGLNFSGTTIPLGTPAPTSGQCLTSNGTSIVGGACGTGGGGGVTTFNGRSGAVTPVAADYSAYFMPLGANLGVSSFTAGNMSPLFTTSVANGTSTPDLTFALSQAPANTMLGNSTGSPALPSWIPIPTPGGGGIPGLSSDGTTLTFSGTGGITANQFNSTTTGGFQLTSAVAALPSLPGAGHNMLVSGTDGWYVSNNGAAFVGPLGAGGGSPGNVVTTFNGRYGAVTPQASDYSAFFMPIGAGGGNVTGSGTGNILPKWQGAGTVSALTNSLLEDDGTALSYNGTGGIVSAQGVTTSSLLEPSPGVGVTAPAPPSGDNSTRIATTAFVKKTIDDIISPTTPIAPNPAQTPVCQRNASLPGTTTISGLNIEEGDTVLVTIVHFTLTPSPTTTVNDGVNAYTMRAERPQSGNGGNVRIYATDPGAAHAANHVAVYSNAGGTQGLIACVATYKGITGFGNVSAPLGASNATSASVGPVNIDHANGVLFSIIAVNSGVTLVPTQGGLFIVNYATGSGSGSYTTAICINGVANPGSISCGGMFTGTASFMSGVGVELIPGASGGGLPASSLAFGATHIPLSASPPTSGQYLMYNGTSIVGSTASGTAAACPPACPKVVAYNRKSITVTTSNTTDVAWFSCSITNCPAGGYYRIAWDFLAIPAGCTAGTLQINVDYRDEAEPLADYHTGMMQTAAGMGPGRNHVYGYRHLTVAAPLTNGNGVSFSTSSVGCSTGESTAQIVLTVERLQ